MGMRALVPGPGLSPDLKTRSRPEAEDKLSTGLTRGHKAWFLPSSLLAPSNFPLECAKRGRCLGPALSCIPGRSRNRGEKEDGLRTTPGLRLPSARQAQSAARRPLHVPRWLWKGRAASSACTPNLSSSPAAAAAAAGAAPLGPGGSVRISSIMKLR